MRVQIPGKFFRDTVHYVSVQTAQIGKDVPLPMCSATAQKNAELNINKAIFACLHLTRIERYNKYEHY